MRCIPSLMFPALCLPAFAQTGLWAQLTFPTSPSARWGAALVYDSARARLVLVGGTLNGSLGIAETWENDGANWILRGNIGPVGVPNSGITIAAVYDSQRQRTVVVRGDNSNFTTQTWEWDGTNWAQRSSGGPSPRQNHAMAFDSARGVTVLFGGYRASGPSTFFGDTWEWNGTYWLESFGVAGPAPRQQHSMVFDSARNRIVLQGGRSGVDFTDTWEWNGVAWTNMQASNQASYAAAFAYDSERQRATLFGGRMAQFSTTLDQTWGYAAPAQVASVVPFGTGCAGPTGVPLLAAQSGSLPRLGSTFLAVLSNLPVGPTNPGIGWLGFDNTNWNGVPLPLPLDVFGFPGCSALLAPSQAFLLTNVGGTATWPTTIPFLPAFAGLHFYLQGAVLVLGFSPGGLVFTRGLDGVVGR